MPLFGASSQDGKLFKEAKRYSHPSGKEFDLDEAISLLEGALTLKPDEEQYRQKLAEIREIKEKSSLEFSMQGGNYRAVSFSKEERGVVLDGYIERGTIRDGDKVWIEGNEGTIYEVVSRKGKGFGVAGQNVSLAIVTEWKTGLLSRNEGPWQIKGVVVKQ